MKILLLAPHPFYQERGTPIAVDLLAGALAERGDEVDVLTYHEGADRSYPGKVHIHRIRPRLPASGVRPGFSAKKLICDASMMPAAFSMAKAKKYDAVHAVEESVFVAMAIKKRHGVPYIFDMDSSMPEQMADSHAIMKPFLPILRSMERAAIRGAVSVVPMCDSLAQVAREAGAADVRILRDIPLTERPGAESMHEDAGDLPEGSVRFLYLGNLEPYQGPDLMLQSFREVLRDVPGAVLLVAGGNRDHITRYRETANQLKIAERTHFLGPRPASMMKSLFDKCDVLLSPRLKGNNTPMKIYSYMASGKPIVATNLPTHTQVLDASTAVLAEPDAESFGKAMAALALNPERRDETGAEARRVASEKYSYRVFKQTVNGLYDNIARVAEKN
jgi:glycosyltransferase involved in cell wall biosynthesis